MHYSDRHDDTAGNTSKSHIHNSKKKSMRLKTGTSKNSSGHFIRPDQLNEYDLPVPGIEDMRDTRRKGHASKIRPRGNSRDSRVTSRDRTNSRTRTYIEDSDPDYSIESKARTLDFLVQLATGKFGVVEEKKKKVVKKVKKKARSKSKDVKCVKLQTKLKKPKKSVPSTTTHNEPKSNHTTAKKSPEFNKKKSKPTLVSAAKSKTVSKTQSRAVSRSASRKPSVGKSRVSSKKKKLDKHKEEYFTKDKLIIKPQKPHSIAVAKGKL